MPERIDSKTIPQTVHAAPSLHPETGSGAFAVAKGE